MTFGKLTWPWLLSIMEYNVDQWSSFLKHGPAVLGTGPQTSQEAFCQRWEWWIMRTTPLESGCFFLILRFSQKRSCGCSSFCCGFLQGTGHRRILVLPGSAPIPGACQNHGIHCAHEAERFMKSAPLDPDGWDGFQSWTLEGSYACSDGVSKKPCRCGSQASKKSWSSPWHLGRDDADKGRGVPDWNDSSSSSLSERNLFLLFGTGPFQWRS